MAVKVTPRKDPTLFVFWTKVTAEPYAGYFDGGGEMHIALTIPGGFSGFGRTSEDAIRMAKARAIISKTRALKCGLSFDDWFVGIWRRMTPGLLVLLNAHKDAASDEGADDGLHFKSASTNASDFPRDLVRSEGWSAPLPPVVLA